MVVFPIIQFLDDDGNPLVGGTVTFYDSGTENKKDIYDEAGTPVDNPQILDAGGFVRDRGVYLGDGTYRVFVESADSLFTKEIDPWYGDLSSETLSQMLVSDTIADLKALDVENIDSNTVFVNGYYGLDAGGGVFTYISDSTEEDDGGMFIKPTVGAGCWHRRFNGTQITPIMFGILQTVANWSSRWGKLITYAYNSQTGIYIPKGGADYYIGANLTIGSNTRYPVTIETGTRFNGTTTGLVLTIDCKLDGYGETALVDGTNVNLYLTGLIQDRVYGAWFSSLKKAFDIAYNPAYQKITVKNSVTLTEYIGTESFGLITLELIQNADNNACITLNTNGAIDCADIIVVGSGGAITGTDKKAVKTFAPIKSKVFFASGDGATYSGTDLDDAQYSATWAGTRNGNLVWETDVKFNTSNAGTYSATCTNDFCGGSITGDDEAVLTLGYMGVTSQNCLISFDSISSFVISNPEIKANWFSSTDFLVVSKNGNDKVFDLCSGTYSLDTPIEFNSIKIRNGSLSMTGIGYIGINATSATDCFELLNVNVTHTATTVTPFLITGTHRTVTIKNCDINASGSDSTPINMFLTGSVVNVLGNKITGSEILFYLLNGYLNFSSNQVITSIVPSNGYVLFNGASTSRMVVTGNEFNTIAPKFYAPERTVIKDNVFLSVGAVPSKVYFEGAGASVVKDLQMTGNTFIGVAGTGDNLSVVGGFADFGHSNVVIKDNPCEGTEYSTEVRFYDTQTGADSTTTLIKEYTYNTVVFPYADEATFFTVAFSTSKNGVLNLIPSVVTSGSTIWTVGSAGRPGIIVNGQLHLHAVFTGHA